jgi:hypothetical protein
LKEENIGEILSEKDKEELDDLRSDDFLFSGLDRYGVAEFNFDKECMKEIKENAKKLGIDKYEFLRTLYLNQLSFKISQEEFEQYGMDGFNYPLTITGKDGLPKYRVLKLS